jgi:septum formation protein
MLALGQRTVFSTGLCQVVLILASASAIRRKMLEHAGVDYRAVPADIDEGAVKRRGGRPEEIALELAEAKAATVSRENPGDWVVGSDSVVAVDERIFDKPPSREEAARHLRLFSGKRMRLTSAVAIARDGEIDWRAVDTAELQVRVLSEEFIDAYLDREWPDVGWCVGVFRMEGLGVQLFERVKGSHFTILGMPLVPLLGALREKGILQS